MGEEITVDKVMDLKGLACPMPVVKVSKGIKEAAIAKLFDPFFTTKPPGEGTGLGLYISHNIISQNHKGKIVITSRPGGTCFKIKLPMTLEAAEE